MIIQRGEKEKRILAEWKAGTFSVLLLTLLGLACFGGVTVLKLKLISYKKVKITKITKYIYKN